MPQSRPGIESQHVLHLSVKTAPDSLSRLVLQRARAGHAGELHVEDAVQDSVTGAPLLDDGGVTGDALYVLQLQVHLGVMALHEVRHAAHQRHAHALDDVTLDHLAGHFLLMSIDALHPDLPDHTRPVAAVDGQALPGLDSIEGEGEAKRLAV